jgi:anaerobic sulfite reductase subunit B
MVFEPVASKIVSIKKYTSDTWMFRVKSEMNPMPGQFFQLSLFGYGEVPLASCSSNDKYLDMLVRSVGNVTHHLFKLRKGDKVFLRGAYGNGYNLDEMKNKNLILIAGGTGIAPVISLIDYIEKNRKDFGNVLIFFAFRDESHMLLGDRLKRWGKKFDLTICLDHDVSGKYSTGHVNDVMAKRKIDARNSLAVLCGPEMMMLSVTKELNKQGISNDKIYWNMERRMECAIGCCGRCLIKDKYCCRDGPVFRYDQIKEALEDEAKK